MISQAGFQQPPLCGWSNQLKDDAANEHLFRARDKRMWDKKVFKWDVPPCITLFLNSFTFDWRIICFTASCCFLPHISMNQPWVYTCPLPLQSPSRLPPQPTPLGYHGALGWAPCVIQRLPTGYLFYSGKACFHSTLSIRPLSPSPTMSVSLLSLSPSPLLLVAELCSVLWDPRDSSPPGSSVHGILQARILDWGCHFLLQEIFLTQGLNSGLLHCRQILNCLSHQGSMFTALLIISSSVPSF